MDINITEIVIAVIGLASTIITCFLVPYIKTKTNKDQQQTLALVVQTAVQAAEQIFTGTGLGQQKKMWVANYLAERGYIADIDAIDASVDALIESMVYQMNKE